MGLRDASASKNLILQSKLGALEQRLAFKKSVSWNPNIIVRDPVREPSSKAGRAGIAAEIIHQRCKEVSIKFRRELVRSIIPNPFKVLQTHLMFQGQNQRVPGQTPIVTGMGRLGELPRIVSISMSSPRIWNSPRFGWFFYSDFETFDFRGRVHWGKARGLTE